MVDLTDPVRPLATPPRTPTEPAEPLDSPIRVEASTMDVDVWPPRSVR
jgi:hypothetical protein